jgi:hypothetical protein
MFTIKRFLEQINLSNINYFLAIQRPLLEQTPVRFS